MSNPDPPIDPANETGEHPGVTLPRCGPTPVEETPRFPAVPGYEILGELGRGAMGVVYKARQAGLNRLVAIKMILDGRYAGPEALARFRAEGEFLARMQHPGVVQIHDLGVQGGKPYFVLEYAEGGSLAGKLGGRPWEPAAAAALVATLARTAAALHAKGIIHRDLKPGNVLLAADGAAKIGDFGLARQAEGGHGLTASGAVLGTPSYMAPEQADGRRRAVGLATDVYALGALLYELVAGRPPFRAETPLDTILQVLSEEPPAPRRLCPACPRDLETICLKCLQKEPSRRYASAGELAEDLERFLRQEPIRGRRLSPAARLAGWARRHPALVTALACVAGQSFLFWIWSRMGDESREKFGGGTLGIVVFILCVAATVKFVFLPPSTRTRLVRGLSLAGIIVLLEVFHLPLLRSLRAFGVEGPYTFLIAGALVSLPKNGMLSGLFAGAVGAAVRRWRGGEPVWVLTGAIAGHLLGLIAAGSLGVLLFSLDLLQVRDLPFVLIEVLMFVPWVAGTVLGAYLGARYSRRRIAARESFP
jgi:hypothetical protein